MGVRPLRSEYVQWPRHLLVALLLTFAIESSVTAVFLTHAILNNSTTVSPCFLAHCRLSNSSVDSPLLPAEYNQRSWFTFPSPDYAQALPYSCTAPSQPPGPRVDGTPFCSLL